MPIIFSLSSITRRRIFFCCMVSSASLIELFVDIVINGLLIISLNGERDEATSSVPKNATYGYMINRLNNEQPLLLTEIWILSVRP